MNAGGVGLSVTVHKRTGIVFRGMASSVSGTNDIGPFDILREHANFVSVVHTELILRSDRDTTIRFDRGILRVFQNTIEVYIGI